MVTIREWLKDLGLEEYAELFEEEQVSVHLPPAGGIPGTFERFVPEERAAEKRQWR